MVYFLLTVKASISHWALTEVATFGVVSTTPTIEARPICTGVGAQLTVVAIKARWAGAFIAAIVVLYWKQCKQWLEKAFFWP